MIHMTEAQGKLHKDVMSSLAWQTLDLQIQPYLYHLPPMVDIQECPFSSQLNSTKQYPCLIQEPASINNVLQIFVLLAAVSSCTYVEQVAADVSTSLESITQGLVDLETLAPIVKDVVTFKAQQMFFSDQRGFGRNVPPYN